MRDLDSICNDLEVARRRVYQLEWEAKVHNFPILTHLVDYLQRVEPNWNSIYLMENSEDCWYNGPRHGDQPLRDVVQETFRRLGELTAGVQWKTLCKRYEYCIRNPLHRLEVIRGRTVLDLDNCDTVWVKEVLGDRFVGNVYIGGEVSYAPEYNMEEAKALFERANVDFEVGNPDIVEVHYAPFRFVPGTTLYENQVFSSAMEFAAAQRVLNGRYVATHPKE